MAGSEILSPCPCPRSGQRHFFMPFTYDVRHAGRLVVVTGSPDGTSDEASAIMVQAGQDPDVVHPAAYVVDVRSTREVPTSGEARGIALYHARREAPWTSITAMVVREGEQYGIARMIDILTSLDGAQARVFQDPEEAQAWALDALDEVERSVPMPDGDT